MTKLILHAVQDTGRYQRAEGIADQATAGEERRPKTELFASVPLREQEERSWEECGLDEAEEEPRQQCADKATILLEIRTVTLRDGHAHSFVIPVKQEIMPHTIIQHGR